MVCDDPKLENLEVALELARAGSAEFPTDESALRTLATAEYRCGNTTEALEAAQSLRKQSVEKTICGNPYYWFLEALTNEKLGHHAEARAAYDKGVSAAALHANNPNTVKLKLEAERLLNVLSDAKQESK